MRVFIVLLSFALPIRLSFAQVYFSQPSPVSTEVIMGGLPFIVSVFEPLSVPYFTQMTNFYLLLYTGNDSSPTNLYSWDLADTNPATVSNSITFPPSVGPNATNGYFLGIRGSLATNTSIYATYFSTRFTLMNMMGSQPLSSYTLDAGALQTGLSSVLVTCGEPTGASCDPLELKALPTGIAALGTATGVAAPLITTPPVGKAYSSSTSTLTAFSSSATIASVPTITTTNAPLATFSPGTSPATPSNSSPSSSSSKMLPAMAYPIIIAGISLTAACVLFYIYSRYRRKHQHHPKLGKEQRPSSELEPGSGGTFWDRMPIPNVMRRSRAIELDAEKQNAPAELEGDRKRQELEAADVEKVRFELEG